MNTVRHYKIQWTIICLVWLLFVSVACGGSSEDIAGTVKATINEVVETVIVEKVEPAVEATINEIVETVAVEKVEPVSVEIAQTAVAEAIDDAISPPTSFDSIPLSEEMICDQNYYNGQFIITLRDSNNNASDAAGSLLDQLQDLEVQLQGKSLSLIVGEDEGQVESEQPILTFFDNEFAILPLQFDPSLPYCEQLTVIRETIGDDYDLVIEPDYRIRSELTEICSTVGDPTGGSGSVGGFTPTTPGSVAQGLALMRTQPALAAMGIVINPTTQTVTPQGDTSSLIVAFDSWPEQTPNGRPENVDSVYSVKGLNASTRANDHGYFVASQLWLVAPNAPVRLYRVLGDDSVCGSLTGSISNLIATLAHLRSDMVDKQIPLDEVVLNMSLGVETLGVELLATLQGIDVEDLYDRWLIAAPDDSLAELFPSTALYLALREYDQSGAMIVAAAGNEALLKAAAPAIYPFVLSVGAVETIPPHDPACFSNSVMVAAPGGSASNTCSNTLPADCNSPSYTGAPCEDRAIIGMGSDGYYAWSGTSFAAPFASALAAMLQLNHAPADVFALIECGVNNNPNAAGVIHFGESLSSSCLP